ncbi:MAG: carboxylesterase family protein [Pseudomonadota bacterium]|nr:carboxylesterase family protein [Pseudomonadota bacterium]
MSRTMVERSTQLGRIRGFERLGVQTYLGLRYAEPAQRFQASVQAQSPWEGIYDATTYRASAAQVPILPEVYGPRPSAPRSEDCLFLNIHTPGTSSAVARPVIVFIHGGSFTGGGGNYYDGTALARGADAVVVSINYRLGVFAALDLAWLGTERDGGGQLWLGDQINALRWLRDNIGDYGGDPDLVTVIGESAGAVSVAALCAAPEAEGLVHRGVACSTGYILPDEPSNDVVGKLARIRKCSRQQAIEFLRSASTDELIALHKRGKALSPIPVCNTPLLPGRTEDLIRRRGATAVPMIAGYATNEGESLDLMLKLATRFPRILLNLLSYFIARAIAAHAAKGKANVPAYIRKLKKATRSIGFGRRFSDLVWTDGFRRGAMEYAEETTRASSRGYVYVMDLPMRFAGQLIRSSHGIDLALTFNVWDDPEHTVPMFAEHPNAAVLAKRWVKMLGHFARHGEPGDALGPWPVYGDGQRFSLRVSGEACVIEENVDALYREKVWQ